MILQSTLPYLTPPPICERHSSPFIIPLARSRTAALRFATALRLPHTQPPQPTRRAYSVLARSRSTRWPLLLPLLCSLLPLAHVHSTASTASCDPDPLDFDPACPSYIMAANPSGAVTPADASVPRTVFPTAFLTHGGGPSYFSQRTDNNSQSQRQGS